VTRRFLTALFLLALATAFAHASSLPELSAASTDTDPATGDQVFKGNARLDYDGAVLFGDQIRYNVEKQTATARGHVSLTKGVQRLLADEIIYRLADKTYTVNRLRFGQYPLYASGDQVSGTPAGMELHHASLAYHEPGFFVPTLTAGKLTVIPGDRIVAEQAWLGFGATTAIPFHRLDQSVNDPLISHMTAKIGYSKSLGAFADLGLHLPVAPGVKFGGDAGFYTARGLLLGPSGTYDVTSPDQEDIGSLKTGYINDHGDKKTDILDRPIHDNRGFIQWEHERTYLSQNVTVINELNYWSDSSVVRDFRGNEFYPVQQPDSFIDATATRTNTVTSLFIRAQPNTYYHVQQRLPEFNFALLPTAIGNGFYERFDASAVALRERQFSLDNDVLTTAPTIKSNRLDAFYSLSRPIVPREWLVIDPVAGARVTHYLDAVDGKSTYTRVLGEVGADASLRASAVYDYKNEAWGIDGIRHLITPKLSYRYIPSADKGKPYIPQIDDRVFDTSLPPLELGDQRNIDDLSATNTLRLGLDNTFQTRDKTYGSRDLLTLNIAQDFRFHRVAGVKDSSEIHTGVSFMPANWMQFDVYNSFAPQTFTARELNTRFAIHDGAVWSLSLSNQYLQHQIDEYTTEGRYRINEVYQVIGRLTYDGRKSRFNERTIGLRQNINNLWTVQYNVHTYAGNTREGNFGFSVEVRLAGF
jgi:LPS-assembly protein